MQYLYSSTEAEQQGGVDNSDCNDLNLFTISALFTILKWLKKWWDIFIIKSPFARSVRLNCWHDDWYAVYVYVFFIHVSTAHPHSINNSIKARAASVHCHCLFIVLSCSYPHKSEVETGLQIPHWLFLIRDFQTSLLSWILTAQSTKRVHTPKSTGDLRIRSIDLRGGRRYFRCKILFVFPQRQCYLIQFEHLYDLDQHGIQK